MAEITDQRKENEESGAKDVKNAKEVVHVEKGPVEVEELEALEGFTSEEVKRMLKVKEDIARGLYNDITDEHRKLLFVQWLIDHDKLGS
jgi:hypothetical protein